MPLRDRLITALQNKESDRIPFSPGRSWDTGLYWDTYWGRRTYLGCSRHESVWSYVVQQTFMPDANLHICL